MREYKTPDEKALEWNISPRHVQHLCRTGKIEGAVKRGGLWRIPDDTPIPVKNTKADVTGFRYVGTKKKIFESAIHLFVQCGYNDVSLKDIADRVGIRQSTIYNHFKSKQEILDTIYDFYCYHHLLDRPDIQEMEPVLLEESLPEVINRIRYDFKEEYAQKMADIIKIIFQRLAIDDRAREIGRTLFVEEGVSYVEEVFNLAIEKGRLAPFNTRTMAVFINSVRLFTLFQWIIDPSPEVMNALSHDEQEIYREAEKLIVDLRPPVESGG